VAVKQAVYAVPDSPGAREDFEWLKTEIESAGGQASIFAADTVDTWSNDALIEEFRRSRQDAYEALARDAEQLIRRMSARRRPAAARPPRGAVQRLRQRLAAVEQVDFFGSAGRDRVVALLHDIDQRAGGERQTVTGGSSGATTYRRRLWVTRPRPGVDRMASAWLIRRFVDPEASFAFVADRAAAPDGAVPFDMFGVEFTHRADLCTFEVLCDTFALADQALVAVAAIVHDLDLKDGRFGATGAPTVGLLIEGLRLAHADDQTLLTHGIGLFDALYRGLAQVNRPSGPRRVANRSAVKKKAVRR
jgi:hypothetical protein